MVLVTLQLSSRATVSLRTISWNKRIRLKQNVVQLQMNSRRAKCILLNNAFPLRPAARHTCEVKRKPFHILSFKGNVQNDEAGDASSKPLTYKNSVKISFVQQDREEMLMKSSTAQDVPVHSASESKKTRSRSEAIHGLFTKWLSLLRTEAPGQAGDDILEEPPQMDDFQEQKAANMKESGEILKVVLCYFLGLDSTIKVPLLIFLPLFLAVNVVYGAEVSRELTPLWVIGPLVVALYVTLFRWIVSLYVFSFKQVAKVIKNLPTYYNMGCSYLAEGKLKGDIHGRLLKPVLNIRNLDYKELPRRKWKAFREWLVERYLDFVESIWPYYCRTVRFLKRANLI